MLLILLLLLLVLLVLLLILLLLLLLLQLPQGQLQVPAGLRVIVIGSERRLEVFNCFLRLAGHKARRSRVVLGAAAQFSLPGIPGPAIGLPGLLVLSFPEEHVADAEVDLGRIGRFHLCLSVELERFIKTAFFEVSIPVLQ